MRRDRRGAGEDGAGDGTRDKTRRPGRRQASGERPRRAEHIGSEVVAGDAGDALNVEHAIGGNLRPLANGAVGDAEFPRKLELLHRGAPERIALFAHAGLLA